LLYAMSRPEPARYVPVAQSYIETFKPVPDDEEPATPPRSYVLEPAAGEGLAYLENVLKTVFGRAPGLSDIGFRLSEQSLILSLPSTGVIDQAGSALTRDMTTALFDLGGVLANIDNRIAVHGFVDPGDASAPSWARAVGRADVVASALGAAGYGRPITASARIPGPETAIGSDIEIVIMAQDDFSAGDSHD
ncbi:MAG: hypothetical protein SFV19_21035, partial [Rhodospirillaceae bacterium]|nr:hypothetical protein [Rhodospirillaceae bacterium]